MNDPDVSSDTRIRRLTREEARQRTRERLLKAAAEIFRRKGYAGASLEAVAEAAGFTKGAVYSNFATKVDLYLALLEGWITADAEEGRLLEDQPVDAFVDGLDQRFKRQVIHDPLSVVLDVEFWLAAARDPQIRKKIVAGAEDFRTHTGRVIDRQLARARLKSHFTGRELGIICHGLAGGLALDHQLEPDAIDPKLFGRALRVLFGLEPTKATIRSRPTKPGRLSSRHITAALPPDLRHDRPARRPTDKGSPQRPRGTDRRTV